MFCLWIILGIMEKNQGKEDLSEKLGQITSGLHQLAKERNIPVIVLSQFNRSLGTRSDRTQMLSDLKGSGDIQQDAGTTWFVHRLFFFDKKAEPGDPWFIIGKYRNPPAGKLLLKFEGRTTSSSFEFVEGFS